MVEREINEKLIGDVTRICTVANTWPAEYVKVAGSIGTSWAAKAMWVHDQLNQDHEQMFIDIINEILMDQAAEDRINGILDKTYLTNTRTLLKYRIDNAGKNPEIKLKDDDLLNKKDYHEIKSMLESHGNTVIGYHALEICGTIDALTEVLKENLGDVEIEIQIINRSEPVVYREKVPYLGHKIWACTQLMPLIIVKLINE